MQSCDGDFEVRKNSVNIGSVINYLKRRQGDSEVSSAPYNKSGCLQMEEEE